MGIPRVTWESVEDVEWLTSQNDDPVFDAVANAQEWQLVFGGEHLDIVGLFSSVVSVDWESLENALYLNRQWRNEQNRIDRRLDGKKAARRSLRKGPRVGGLRKPKWKKDVERKKCECCGRELVRKRFRNGELETPGNYKRRRFCNRSCAISKRHQKSIADDRT